MAHHLVEVVPGFLVDPKAVTAVSIGSNDSQMMHHKPNEYWVNFWIGIEGKCISTRAFSTLEECLGLIDRFKGST